MTEALLVLQNVEKRFGGLRAIAGVSMEVPERQIFGLIGPNGAGKTTLINCITGNYKADSGDVRFQGRSIRGQAPYRIALGGIGRTFQNVRLFTQMTVMENVMVAAHHRTVAGVLGAMLRTKHYDQDERGLRARALELLEIFELHELADEQAGALPYGRQRRLEIARALMLEPKLLLLDEPAAGLNSREADTLKTQIRWLRDRFALTIVLVEHNMQVVMGACEQVLCMDHGETIALGTPEEIRNHPAVLAAYRGQETAQETAAEAEESAP